MRCLLIDIDRKPRTWIYGTAAACRAAAPTTTEMEKKKGGRVRTQREPGWKNILKGPQLNVSRKLRLGSRKEKRKLPLF